MILQYVWDVLLYLSILTKENALHNAHKAILVIKIEIAKYAAPTVLAAPMQDSVINASQASLSKMRENKETH